jgi:hypothetical protein
MSKFSKLARRIISANKITLRPKTIKVSTPKRKILAKQVKPVKSGFWKH